MLEKLKILREKHLKAFHNTVFYPYQEEISDRILEALLQNLRLTSNATEEQIKRLKLVEIPVEISRQAGKTTAIVLTVEFIMIYLTKMFNRRLNIGIFAPQQEQANTDLDRLKEALNRSNEMYEVDEEDQTDEERFKERNNQKLVRLPNGTDCYIFPVTTTSKPESKSLDIMIFEESQDMNDKIVKEQIWPMGAAKNSPRIYIGTAGTRICYFRKIGQGNGALKLYFDEIVKQRRTVYEKTKDAQHLIYEQYVLQEIEKHGKDSDEVQRPYFGRWLIGTGQFTTEEELKALVEPRKPTFQYKKSECFAGIDTAKNVDSTVVTITRLNPDTGKRDLLNWMELKGDNYQDQFDIITGFNSKTGQMTGDGFLDRYNVVALAIDSTGQGDFMPDLFERHTQWQDENTGLYRVPFNLQSKDKIYKNLMASFKSQTITLPSLNMKIGERFQQQMLDLQKEYKGQFLSCHHPKDASGGVNTDELHDDYPDSLALCEWSYAKYYSSGEPQFVIVREEKERKVQKDESGAVVQHWPGMDDDW